MSRPVLLALSSILLLLTSGCSKPAAEVAQVKNVQHLEQTYRVKGVVRGIDAANKSVTVEHEEIPNYMPAMTMPFDARSPSDLQTLEVGNGIKFRLVVTEKDSWIDQVSKIDPTEVKLPPKRSAIVANTPIAEPLKAGDRLPDFVLVDQQGRRISRETFAGKPLFITFIFTRCPLPNFCPLMSRNFVEIQKALAENPRKDEVRYLSISFDPAFDTPKVLAAYARQYDADRERWQFATGSLEEIKKLTQAFSVYVQPEQGTISHGLATVLIDAEGIVRKIFRGNSWATSEAVEALEAL